MTNEQTISAMLRHKEKRADGTRIPWSDIASEMGVEMEALKSSVRRYRKSNDLIRDIADDPASENDRVISYLRDGTTLHDIAEKMEITPWYATVLIDNIRDQGLNVMEIGEELKISKTVVPEETIIDNHWHGDKIVRFGLTGDTHFGSRFTQITHLHSMYDTFAEEGIDTVYHTGDITEGENMRAGHAYECYVHGADEHITEVVKNYPSRQGITTRFILGNHDHSFVKHVGLNIGKPIASVRPDMEYLGQDQAFIQLTPNCTMELQHPGGGSAYALSYRPQKIAESLEGGTKPNILAIGHFHKMEQMFYRNIHIFQTGTMQAQSDWMRNKALAAHVGFWIVEIHVEDDGSIRRMQTTMFPFYKSIKEDWKNWQ